MMCEAESSAILFHIWWQ